MKSIGWYSQGDGQWISGCDWLIFDLCKWGYRLTKLICIHSTAAKGVWRHISLLIGYSLGLDKPHVQRSRPSIEYAHKPAYCGFNRYIALLSPVIYLTGFYRHFESPHSNSLLIQKTYQFINVVNGGHGTHSTVETRWLSGWVDSISPAGSVGCRFKYRRWNFSDANSFELFTHNYSGQLSQSSCRGR